jgi:hypothetical protein
VWLYAFEMYSLIDNTLRFSQTSPLLAKRLEARRLFSSSPATNDQLEPSTQRSRSMTSLKMKSGSFSRNAGRSSPRIGQALARSCNVSSRCYSCSESVTNRPCNLNSQLVPRSKRLVVEILPLSKLHLHRRPGKPSSANQPRLSLKVVHPLEARQFRGTSMARLLSLLLQHHGLRPHNESALTWRSSDVLIFSMR